jgi:FkbM family methyltransferase
MSYSQLGQDTFVVEFLNQKKGGYFVEVGAFNGIHMSNTYLLETEYAWTGMCIEPVPAVFEQLKANRACHYYNYAVTAVGDEQLEFCVAGVLSGLTEHISPPYLHIKDCPKVTVTAKTLTYLLDMDDAPAVVDYLSIDTEGSEFEVLKGIDFERYQFRIIDLEHNNVEPRRSEMRQFLEERGYQYHSENKWDDRYIHEALVLDSL